jgi:hypothetical protein
MYIVISFYEIVLQFWREAQDASLFRYKPIKQRPANFTEISLVSQSAWQLHYVCDGNRRQYRTVVLHRTHFINPLTPNDHCSGRTAPLTSKRCILYIFSTNIGTEYFKHGIYSPFFSLQNAVCFIILTYLVPVLFTFWRLMTTVVFVPHR